MTASDKRQPTSTPIAPAAAPQRAGDSRMLAKRRERIREFEIESLGKTDPLEAALGACASDLMMGMLYLRESMDRAWVQESEPVEQLSQLLPCLDHLGKITKQLEALVDLQLSLQDRRMLSNELRQKLVRAKKKKKLVLPGTASPGEVGPPTQKADPKKPR